MNFTFTILITQLLAERLLLPKCTTVRPTIVLMTVPEPLRHVLCVESLVDLRDCPVHHGVVVEVVVEGAGDVAVGETEVARVLLDDVGGESKVKLREENTTEQYCLVDQIIIRYRSCRNEWQFNRSSYLQRISL